MVEATTMPSSEADNKSESDQQTAAIHQANPTTDWGVTSVRQVASQRAQMEENKEALLRYISTNVIGSNHDTLLRTVFGEKPHCYMDYTASGKSLRFIEDYITSMILPLYANTHSMQSASGK